MDAVTAILSELREIRAENKRILALLNDRKEILLTPAQAADYLGKSASTLRNYRKRGLIKTVISKDGKRIGYSQADLDKIKGY